MSGNSNFEKRYGALMRSVKRREVELAEEAASKAAEERQRIAKQEDWYSDARTVGAKCRTMAVSPST